MVFSIQQFFRKQLLLLAVGLSGILALVLTLAAYADARSSAGKLIYTQAQMLAIALSDQATLNAAPVTQILERSLVNPHILAACVRDASGTLLSSVKGLSVALDKTPAELCTDVEFTQKLHVIVREASVRDKTLPRALATVQLQAISPSIWSALLFWGPVSLLLSVIITALCGIMGMRLERTMLVPIRQIANTAQRVTLYKDYSLRVENGALNVVPREIDALTESFNAMLHEIEDRDNRLTRKSDELEKSRQTAVAANLAKSQFLANVSHELRTPLNAIIGFSTMLHEQQFGTLGNEKYVEYARDIHDSGKHLLDVINDILDLTKAETGMLSVTFESLTVTKIVEKALHIVAGQAHERKVDIYTDIPDKLPKIYADRVRLVQILLNLLSNAIKFTGESGKVVVKVRAEAGRGGVHYFTFTVEDSGIGMSDADIAKAFSSFNQSDSGLNRKYDGAGLGLPLTKRLVELHHGKIKITSELGKGTTVTVRLTSDPALLD